MTDEFYTIAEATLGVDSTSPGRVTRARLMVYIDSDQGADRSSGRGSDRSSEPGPDSEPDGEIVTRLVELPDDVPVIFGRSRTCAVYARSHRVSRNHARVIRRGGEITVEDLGSRNGTLVNGGKITGPTRLVSGDEIAVGPIVAVVSMTTGPSRATRVGATRHLDERLAAEVDRGLRYQRPFSLLMLRVEGDGEAVDEAIARLAGELRAMDTLAEYGPDELAVLMPERDLEDGLAASKLLIAAARRDLRGNAPPITVRAGIASLPEHGSQAGAILGHARDALRQARTAERHGAGGAGKAGEIVAVATEATSSPSSSSSGAAIVADPQMKRLYAMVRKVARTSMTVLVHGETGAGKEIIAEAIHRDSKRKDGPFMRLNCACIADTLLESELFGHERGAFTGADRQRAGYFEAASGGTLFLDEIGEISPALQAKLLRVLETRTITRTGGTREIAVDTRVVCATNRDLAVEVERGAFRSDLYFRVSGFALVVPPLRDRPDEIPLLAEHFLAMSAREFGVVQPRLSPEASAGLATYDWPGNVRELRNAMERAVVLQVDGVIGLEHLPERVREGQAARPGASPGLAGATSAEIAAGADGTSGGGGAVTDVREHVADVERQQVIVALDACGGNQTQAARKLGLSRRAFIYRMEKYGLKPPPASRR